MEIGYINLLNKRLEKYGEQYAKKPLWVFIKLVFWSFTYCLTKLFIPSTKSIGKDKNILYVGIAAGGGFGDYLLSANYVLYLKKFLDSCKIQLDFYAGSPYSAEAVLINSELVDNLYKNKYHRTAKKYDLYISLIEPFPNIMKVNRKKIEKLCPKLLKLVDEYLANEKLALKTIKYSPQCNTAAYIMSMIQNRNRVQMADINGNLGIQKTITFSPSITLDESEVLKKFNLQPKKYITLNRCVGELNNFWDSNKMWELNSYIKLIQLIKENYRNYKIVQVGYSVERSPLIEGIDISLVGKTNLEEAKVIMKNAVLHIDGEGGLVHLRHALRGGQSVVLFGPTSPDFYGYPENINIKMNKCYYPCDWVINKWQTHCLNNNKHICMKSIRPEMVFDGVKTVLQNQEVKMHE